MQLKKVNCQTPYGSIKINTDTVNTCGLQYVSRSGTAGSALACQTGISALARQASVHLPVRQASVPLPVRQGSGFNPQ